MTAMSMGRFEKTLTMVAVDSIDKACAEKTRLITYRADVKARKWLIQTNKKIKAHQDKALEKN